MCGSSLQYAIAPCIVSKGDSRALKTQPGLAKVEITHDPGGASTHKPSPSTRCSTHLLIPALYSPLQDACPQLQDRILLIQQPQLLKLPNHLKSRVWS